MKKLNLLFLLASLFAVGGAKALAYNVSDLTTAGWEEVTSLDNATVSQYVYVFYSVQGENLMLAYDKGTPTRQNTWTAVYHTAKNPFASAHMVWLLDYHAQYHYALKSAFNSTYFMQSHRNAAHRVCIDYETAHTEWDDWDITYDAKEKWTIRNSVSGAINSNTDLYIGPWDTKSFIDGSEVAGNKSGDDVGHFKIYRMLKTDYDEKKAAYLAEQTQFLTDNGWNEVTTSIDNDDLSQYFYVFYSVEGENLMLAQGNVPGYQQNLLTGVYRTATDPIENSQMVWMIDHSDTYKYGLRNLSNPDLYMQSRGTGKDGNDNVGPWNIQFEWERSQSQWTRFNLAYSDDSKSWTIENNAANNNDDTAPYHDKYIGPWVENASSFSDGKAVAGNKTGSYVGHFKLYRMKKSVYYVVYYGKKYYPEFTAVTSTDQLTDDNMAANYYIIVAETNPELAVTARNRREDVNVRLKYVTQSVFTNAAQIWTLQANGEGGYSFRNLKKDHGLLQTYNDDSNDNGAWACAILDIQSSEALTKFIPTSDDDNGFIIENGSHKGKYLGLWYPEHGYRSGENMAANKSGDNIAHFYIYSISRSDYKTQFLANNSEVTDIFMTNPHVENTHGWEGDNVGLYSPNNYYTGATDNVVLDKNLAEAKMHQQVTLPAGSYILKAATRAATDQEEAWLYVYDSSISGYLDIGDILKKGDQYADGALHFGWNWNYMAFTLDSEKTVQIGFYKAAGSWASADDFHLYKGVVSMNETSTSVDFPAGEHANVVMSRNITHGKWATLCLPFSMDKPDGWEVRELSSVTESGGVYTLHFADAASLEAGKPYMVKTAEDVTRIVATDVEVLKEPVDQTVDGVTMKGVFTSGYVPSGRYFVSGNKFYRAADESNTLKAFRAYFEINGSNNARSLILNIDEATSVTTLDGQQPVTAQPEAVFDLSGRRQMRLVPGINIVRQADGTVKKVFVK